MTTIRLILGDQLNPLHAWYDHIREDVVYVIMEVRQETDYVLHHAQKILAILARMPDYDRANIFGHEADLPAWFWRRPHSQQRLADATKGFQKIWGGRCDRRPT